MTLHNHKSSHNASISRVFPRAARMAMLGLALGFLVAGCSPTVAYRGNLVSDDQIKEVKIGEATRDDVIDTLGPPTVKAPFDESTWYYIGEHTEQYSFFDPNVLERRILAVRFDEANHVATIDDLTNAEPPQIAMDGSITPSAGYELTLMEQFMSALRRPSLHGTNDNHSGGASGGGM